jgi:hypothetical protein
MKLNSGTALPFDGYTYLIQRLLGSGAVAEAYLAELQVPGLPALQLVLKVVREDARDDNLRRQGVLHEAEVLKKLNLAEDAEWPAGDGAQRLLARAHRLEATADRCCIVRLLDDGVIDGQPFLVQELAPATVFRPEPITIYPDLRESIAAERATLQVFERIVATVALAHSLDLALIDFEPLTKGDRIRAQQRADHLNLDLKIIDWNITGDRADQAQDLLYLGGHLYSYLLGQHLPQDAFVEPPTTLAMGTTGWARLSEGSRQILQRLFSRDPAQRYPSARDLLADLAWWVGVLAVLDQPGPVYALKQLLWSEQQPSHSLAVADLALKAGLMLSDDERQEFEKTTQQARGELERAQSGEFAQYRFQLERLRAFGAAARGFQGLVDTNGLAPEIARRSRIYLRLAQAGECPATDSETWIRLQHAVELLVRQEWQAARDTFQQLLERRTALEACVPVQELFALTKAVLQTQHAAELVEQVYHQQEHGSVAEWLADEQRRIALFEQALEQLRAAKDAIPWEPEFKEQYTRVEAQRQLRARSLQYYEQLMQLDAEAGSAADDAMLFLQQQQLPQARARYQQAAERALSGQTLSDEILRHDATQARARVYRKQFEERSHAVDQQLRRIDEIEQAATLKQEAQRLREQSEYPTAVKKLHQALALNPPDAAQIQENLRQVNHLARHVQDAYEQLLAAREQLRHGQASLAEEQLNSLTNAESMSYLPERVLQNYEQLRSQVRPVVEVFAAWDRGEVAEVLRLLEQVERALAGDTAPSEAPTTIFAGRLAEIANQARALAELRPQLENARTFDGLLAIVAQFTQFSPAHTVRLREQWFQKWLALVRSLPDVGEVERRLAEARSMFTDISSAALTAMQNDIRLWHAIEMSLSQEFDLRQPQTLAEIRALHEQIQQLHSQSSWREVQARATKWRTQLITIVRETFIRLADQIHQSEPARRFQQARELKRIWDELPGDLHLETMAQLQGTNAARLIAELESYFTIVDGLRADLADMNQPIPAVLETARKQYDMLASLHYVSSDALGALIRALEDGADLDAHDWQNLDPLDYSRAVVALNRLTASLPQALAGLPTNQRNRADQPSRIVIYTQRLRAHVLSAAQAAPERLRALAAPELAAAAPNHLRRAFWNAAFWQYQLEMLPSESGATQLQNMINDALKSAHEQLSERFHRIIAALNTAEHTSDLRHLSEDSAALKAINVALRQPPDEMVALIPDERSLTIASFSDATELEQLRADCLLLAEMLGGTEAASSSPVVPNGDQRMIAAQPPESGDDRASLLLYPLRSSTNSLLGALERLEHNIRSRQLAEQPAALGGLLRRLKDALQIQRALLDDLTRIRAAHYQGDDIAALDLLNSETVLGRFVALERFHDQPLVDRYRQFIDCRGSLEGIIRQTLDQYLERALGRPDLRRQLRQIRDAVQTTSTSDMVTDALLKCIDARVGQFDPAQQPIEERRLYDDLRAVFTAADYRNTTGKAGPPRSRTGPTKEGGAA